MTNAGVWVWDKIVAFITYPIKLWIILSCIIAYIIFKNLQPLETKGSQPTQQKGPQYLEYTQDKFDKWIWMWEWKYYNSQYHLESVHPCCPECETPLVASHSGYYSMNTLVCPRGHEPVKGNRGWEAHTENINNIEVLILDNVKKKYFKK